MEYSNTTSTSTAQRAARTITLNVLDSMMGTGKSSWLIAKVNREANIFHPNPLKVIILTPYLEQVERFFVECQSINLKMPSYNEASKQADLISLIDQGHNIVATHALWNGMTDLTLEALRGKGYTLFIDEVLDTMISPIEELKASDVALLINNSYVLETTDGPLEWNPEHDDYEGFFNQAKALASQGRLQHVSSTTMFEVFPYRYFSAFEQIWVLTHQWRGSLMSAYFDMDSHPCDLQLYTLSNGSLLSDTEPLDWEHTVRIQKLVTIEKSFLMNSVGEPPEGSRKNPCSKSWYSNPEHAPELSKLRKALDNIYKNKVPKGPNKANRMLITTFKDYESSLQGTGYKGSFIECGARATNAYGDRDYLAYLVNRFLNPMTKRFLNSRGAYIDEEAFALSSMLQWIFRGAIRNDKPIYIYIPSTRMRKLLERWLALRPPISQAA